MTIGRRDWLRKPLTSVTALFIVAPMLVAAVAEGSTISVPAAVANVPPDQKCTPTNAIKTQIPCEDPYEDVYVWDSAVVGFLPGAGPVKDDALLQAEADATEVARGDRYKFNLASDVFTASNPINPVTGAITGLTDPKNLGKQTADIPTFIDLASKTIGVLFITAHGDGGYLALEYYATYNAALSRLTHLGYVYPLPAGQQQMWAIRRFRGVWALSLTPYGIHQIFAKAKIGIQFQSSCDGNSFFNPDGTDAFNAMDYFGYTALANSCVDASSDIRTLFNDLLGPGARTYDPPGTPNCRVTTVAFNTASTHSAPNCGSVSSILNLRGSNAMYGNVPVPLTLAPSVDSHAPISTSGATNAVAIGGTAASRRSTNPRHQAKGATRSNPGSVTFDTQMDRANPTKVVKVSGCGAKLSDASWDDTGTELSFDYTTSSNASGTVTFTVESHHARGAAPKEGRNDDLDGNQNPSPANGEAPNGTNYVWTAPCQPSRTVSATYSGTENIVVDCSTAPSDSICDWNENTTWTWTEQETMGYGASGTPTTGSLTVTASNTQHDLFADCLPNPGALCDCTGSFAETIGTPSNPPPQMIVWQSPTTFVVDFAPPIASVAYDPTNGCTFGSSPGGGGPGGLSWPPSTQTGLLSVNSGSVSETNAPDPTWSQAPVIETGSGTLTVTVTPSNAPNETGAPNHISASNVKSRHRIHHRRRTHHLVT